MPTRYLEILSSGRPFDIGPDNNSRCQISCNYYSCAAAPVTSFEFEICKLITNAALGVLAVSLFISLNATLPEGDGPYVTVIQTSGRTNEETHNGDKYEHPTFQVIVTALDYSTAMARALAIWRLLDGNREVSVTA
jgi:hypothetical protein